ncbi:MAG: hypothetical protein HY778_01230 [Betaproteobacteria bacterium]|nr:hypothetical protein [Betaproteobacteria bacterium]
MRLDAFALPNGEWVHYLGMGRNVQSGQLAFLALCIGSDVAHFDWDEATPLRSERAVTGFVSDARIVELSPDGIADFVSRERKWVPMALLNVILALRCDRIHGGRPYSIEEIETAFRRVKTIETLRDI